MAEVVLEPLPNGPYLVKGLGRLANSMGETLPTKDVIALCRCGGSQNKPFCDGTHKKKDFSGENLSDRSRDRRVGYVAEGITIHDNRGICSHAGFCSDSLRAVFDPKRKPWIEAHAADADEIAAVVRTCPSGALSYSIGGVEHRDREREPEILVSKDGPYHVRGGIELVDAPWGEGASREHYALCRCGESKNKPFCDGTHWAIEFTDEKN